MGTRDEMAGHEGNFTSIVSRRYLMCFTTSTSKEDFSLRNTKKEVSGMLREPTLK